LKALPNVKLDLITLNGSLPVSILSLFVEINSSLLPDLSILAASQIASLT
jgi:hypothetical protein